MISDERLRFKLKNSDICTGDEVDMARELLSLRPCCHSWNVIRLVEVGGWYQYCTLCGAKKVAE